MEKMGEGDRRKMKKMEEDKGIRVKTSDKGTFSGVLLLGICFGAKHKEQFFKMPIQRLQKNASFPWLRWQPIGEIRTRKPTDSIDCLNYVRACLLYTSPSPRDLSTSRMPSSA